MNADGRHNWFDYHMTYHSADYTAMYTALHLPPPGTPDAAAATESTDEHNHHQESHSNDDNDPESIHWGGREGRKGGRKRGWKGKEKGEESKEERERRGKGREVVMSSLLCPTIKWFWHEHSKKEPETIVCQQLHGNTECSKFGNEKTVQMREASCAGNSFYG